MSYGWKLNSGGTQEIEKWAAAKIFMRSIGPAFFKELRTEQEWGYSVGAADKATSQGLSLLFTIQSTKDLNAVKNSYDKLDK
ncbi:MAG: hypothetical protein IPL83_00050 [Bdellovibrionales bacterium]|nr:hypothetical protein [Bdellovibrionales bacterium]